MLEDSRSRIEFLDLLRGLAAVIMLQGHTFHALLRPEERGNPPFIFSQFFGGQAAAIFLFLSESAVEKNQPLAIGVASAPAYPLYTNFSAFAQDSWKVSQRLNVSSIESSLAQPCPVSRTEIVPD